MFEPRERTEFSQYSLPLKDCSSKSSVSRRNRGEALADPLVVVLGPTASGKSELALRIAQEFCGEIVNFDSIQVYRGFDIGSAKLPLSARGGIPHHLVDVVDPGQLFTAGDFVRMARSVLREIAGRHRLPVLVGGTGFYLRALLEGLSPAPERQEFLRAGLLAREDKRRGSLHRILSRIDPAASARIHQNDVKKLVRALELCMLRRQPASTLQAIRKDALTGFPTIKIGLDPPRTELYERINDRVARMFEGGLIREVEAMLAGGIPSSAKPFESLGYAQAVAHLEGRLSLEEAVTLTRQATRRYAKRQMTWFRREREVEWFKSFGSAPEAQTEAVAYLRNTIT